MIPSLLKKVDSDLQKQLDVLYYKPGLPTQENGDCPPKRVRQYKQTLWKKVSKRQSLQDFLLNLRPCLEVVRLFCTDPKKKGVTISWLMPMITQQESNKRLNRISKLVLNLMRSSNDGPDVPVHWAARAPSKAFPHSVVTSETMDELVVGVTTILSNLFLRDPVEVYGIYEVNKALSKFVVEPLVLDLTELHISDD